MHLSRVTIKNLRSLRRAGWQAPERRTGWHVVLGENASGKTTFLRAIARTLLGFPGAQQELDPHAWRRDSASHGGAEVVVRGDEGFDKGAIGPGEDEVLAFEEGEHGEPNFTSVSAARGFEHLPTGASEGWLSLGYGPYRRFTGGEARLEKYAAPAYTRLERHLTLFNEGAALPEGALWVSRLRWRELEEQKKKAGRNGRSHAAESEAGSLLRHLKALLLRPGILPQAAKLDVSPDGLFFSVGHEAPRASLQLSDGYKSILSLLFDLLRHMEQSYGPGRIFDAEGLVVAPAVVLVDEIDVHLHPTWQQKIGASLKRCFPNVQFIVTTHSPIVCQAADSVMVVRKGIGEQLQGIELDRMRYGNILDALSTGIFGADVARSKKSLKMLERLAELNRRSFRGEELSTKERGEQDWLRSIMLTMDMDRPSGAS